MQMKAKIKKAHFIFRDIKYIITLIGYPLSGAKRILPRLNNPFLFTVDAETACPILRLENIFKKSSSSIKQ